MTLTDGNLSTNNTLTLISDVNGTANMAEITGGSISGDITMQRYVAPGAVGWRFLTSAVSGQTLADWNDDFITSGFTGSDFPSFPFVSMYTYNESTLGDYTQGYTVPSGLTDAIGVGQGYWAYTGSSTQAFTIDVTGPANTGLINLPVTYTNDVSEPATEDGWNMIGNPYPSSIDWDDPDWTKTNVNNAIYIWDPVAQQYASYVGGIGTNGGTGIIASSQAFWVQTNGNSPVLTAREGVKSNTDQAFKRVRKGNGRLKIKIEAGPYSDETVLLLNEQATQGFDELYDAVKLYSNNPAVPAISILDRNQAFAINAIPLLHEDVVIPIHVKVQNSGDYPFYFSNSIEGASLACLFIEDLLTGTFIDINTTPVYQAFVSDTASGPRFLIHMGAAPVMEVSDLSCHDSEDGMIAVKGQGDGPWDYRWMDKDGVLLKEVKKTTNVENLSGLTAGTYQIAVSNSGICGDVTREVELIEPDPVVAKFKVSEPIGTDFIPHELITFTSDVEQADQFIWDFGDGVISEEKNAVHRYTAAGEYTVRLLAKKAGCEAFSEQVVFVSQAAEVVGIEDVEEEERFRVWAAGSQVHLQMERNGSTTIQLSVTNLIGQELHRMEFSNVQQLNETINVSVASGVYLVNLWENGEVTSFKVSLIK